MSRKVYLSPSTQEKNIGAGAYGTEEQRMNELCDLVTAGLLTTGGYTIFRNNPNMTLREVVDDSNLKKPDIHVAIHSNAFNQKSRGALVLCHRYGGKGEELARSIYKRLEAITPTTDLGVREGYKWLEGGKPLYETAYTHAPAVIIEVDFHDNLAGATWIMQNMPLIADAIVSGINDYFGVVAPVKQPDHSFDDFLAELEELIKKYKK